MALEDTGLDTVEVAGALLGVDAPEAAGAVEGVDATEGAGALLGVDAPEGVGAVKGVDALEGACDGAIIFGFFLLRDFFFFGIASADTADVLLSFILFKSIGPGPFVVFFLLRRDLFFFGALFGAPPSVFGRF